MSAFGGEADINYRAPKLRFLARNGRKDEYQQSELSRKWDIHPLPQNCLTCSRVHGHRRTPLFEEREEPFQHFVGCLLGEIMTAVDGAADYLRLAVAPPDVQRLVPLPDFAFGSPEH